MCEIPLIVVVGPTASGKTALGVGLAKSLNGEVISADSMQIYKGISIASAAPTLEEMQGVPHYMLEFADPTKSYSVADYVNQANSIISDINRRGKMPILVGGTGLYVNSLVEGVSFVEQKPDLELRKKLEMQFDKIGAEAMLENLAEFDPDSADKLHASDRRRIIRAFEIYHTTGKTKTKQNELSKSKPSVYKPIFIGITYEDRELLYERINLRVDRMLDSGLLAEAETTLNFPAGTAAAQAIGHKELHSYLRGEKSLEDAIEDLKRGSRRYAKRQLTWFRRNDEINWIYADKTEDVLSEALKIIKTEAF